MLSLALTLFLLGSCDSGTPGQFSLCAETGNQTQVPGTGAGNVTAKPLRLCSYHVNGTIDVPTDTVITAWVEVGSRLCIGDVIPDFTPATPARTITDELADQFNAFSDRPYAWWDPGDEVELEDPASFHLSRSDLQISGELLGEAATIRFRAVSARWQFSDSATGAGFRFTRSFAEVGNYRARGFVKYEVDYQIASGEWVQNATSWELAADVILVPVVEYPRRTLLVAG